MRRSTRRTMTTAGRDAIGQAIGARQRRSLRAVLNATGVVLHTNLGRAPLADVAVRRDSRRGGGYSNLEYDLDDGARGSRYVHCVSLLRELTGAEDAIVVNNGAAALVLALNTLADGREAIVSRGELVEIGGSFRVPDIMAKSGARLVEVGSTNRTHLDDYRRAIARRTVAVDRQGASQQLRDGGIRRRASRARTAPIAGASAWCAGAARPRQRTAPPARALRTDGRADGP